MPSSNFKIWNLEAEIESLLRARAAAVGVAAGSPLSSGRRRENSLPAYSPPRDGEYSSRVLTGLDIAVNQNADRLRFLTDRINAVDKTHQVKNREIREQLQLFKNYVASQFHNVFEEIRRSMASQRDNQERLDGLLAKVEELLEQLRGTAVRGQFDEVLANMKDQIARLTDELNQLVSQVGGVELAQTGLGESLGRLDQYLEQKFLEFDELLKAKAIADQRQDEDIESLKTRVETLENGGSRFSDLQARVEDIESAKASLTDLKELFKRWDALRIVQTYSFFQKTERGRQAEKTTAFLVNDKKNPSCPYPWINPEQTGGQARLKTCQLRLNPAQGLQIIRSTGGWKQLSGWLTGKSAKQTAAKTVQRENLTRYLKLAILLVEGLPNEHIDSLNESLNPRKRRTNLLVDKLTLSELLRIVSGDSGTPERDLGLETALPAYPDKQESGDTVAQRILTTRSPFKDFVDCIAKIESRDESVQNITSKIRVGIAWWIQTMMNVLVDEQASGGEGQDAGDGGILSIPSPTRPLYAGTPLPGKGFKLEPGETCEPGFTTDARKVILSAMAFIIGLEVRNFVLTKVSASPILPVTPVEAVSTSVADFTNVQVAEGGGFPPSRSQTDRESVSAHVDYAFAV